MKLYEGDVEPRVRGPEGRAVELHHSDDQATTVAGVIEHLCGEEEVPPQDIVVLSSHAPERSAVARDLPGRYRPTDQRGKLGKTSLNQRASRSSATVKRAQTGRVR